MKTTDKAIGDYGLDGYKLLTSSSSTMLASLQKAMEKEAWIVITGWTPHWMFDRYPLKFLHDPKGTYGMWNLSMSSDGKDLRRKILLRQSFSAILNSLQKRLVR